MRAARRCALLAHRGRFFCLFSGTQRDDEIHMRASLYIYIFFFFIIFSTASTLPAELEI